MATKTTQTRRPRGPKTVTGGAVSPVEETDGSNGEVKEARAPSVSSSDDAMLNLAGLKDMSISELTHIAKEMGIEGATGLRKQELIFKLLAAQTEKSGLIF